MAPEATMGNGLGAVTFSVVLDVIGKGPAAMTGIGLGAAMFNV